MEPPTRTPLPVPIPLADIQAARERIAGTITRTPLIRLDVEGVDLYAKLENLQPIGSFKLRGATNALALADPAALRDGVYTASAGNMAQGVAYAARRLGIPCSVVAPDHAPRAKLDAVERLGARVVLVPVERWWQVLKDHRYPGLDGLFIHPFSDLAVVAGNATIGLEIVEELPEVAAVLVPYGGGGLSAGIASAVKAVAPGVKVFAAEVETAAPLAASLAAGQPVEIAYAPSWVDGIGGGLVFPEMWPLASAVLDGSIVVSLAQTAEALRILVSRGRVIAEGAGAASVAAGLSGRAESGPVVAVVSGGNIDPARLAEILASPS
jgi:threonine dehydratase